MCISFGAETCCFLSPHPWLLAQNLTSSYLKRKYASQLFFVVVKGAPKAKIIESNRSTVLGRKCFFMSKFVAKRCVTGVCNWGGNWNGVEIGFQAKRTFFFSIDFLKNRITKETKRSWEKQLSTIKAIYRTFMTPADCL